MKKVDVVYILSNNSKDGDDFELRYSLRSLVQQSSWLGKIWLIGYKPEWVQNVNFIECSDPYSYTKKDANIIHKILCACEIEEVSEEFIVNSDDQYFLKIVDPEEIGPFLECPSSLLSCHLKAPVSFWHQRIIQTLDFCRKEGYPQWVFQSHIPYLVSKEHYKKVMTQLPYFKGNGLLTHVYLNLTSNKIVPQAEPKGYTARINSDMSRENAERLLKEATFFNHNDAGLTEVVKSLLNSLFPESSPWEKKN